jgi:hypothetical protein
MTEILEIEIDTTSKKKNVVFIDQNNNGPDNKDIYKYVQKS